MPTPEKTEDGKWRVGDQVFETNAEAWRWIDRHEGEPVSKGEQTAEWIFRKMWDAP